MTATRSGSVSALTQGEPSGSAAAQAGANRKHCVHIVYETNNNPITVSTFTIGGQTYDQALEYVTTTLTVDQIHKVFVWHESAIAARSGSAISFTDDRTISAQAWFHYTIQDTDQADLSGPWIPDLGFSDDQEFNDWDPATDTDPQMLTTSTPDDWMNVTVCIHSENRTIEDWNTLTEQIDEQPGTEFYRVAFADGAGNDDFTTVTLTNFTQDISLIALVFPAVPVASVTLEFACNGVVSLGGSHKDNLDKILSSFDGRLSWTGGEWKIRASVWDTPVHAFSEDHLLAPVKIRGSAPTGDRFNTVRGFFIDPARQYQAVEYPHVSDAAFVTRDGGEILPYELALPMTNDLEMAQRLAHRVLQQGDNQIIADVVVNAAGAKVEIGDSVYLNIEELWPDLTQSFRLVNYRPNADGSFALTLREDTSSRYNEPASFGSDTSDDVTVPAFVVPPPTNLTAIAVPVGINVRWVNPQRWAFDFVDVYMSGTNQWDDAVKIASVRGDSYVDPVDEGETRYYWARARRNNGEVSVRVPDSDTTTITATAGQTAGCTFNTLANHSLLHNVTDPSDANCGIRLDSDGFVYTRTGTGSWTQGEQWIGSCINSQYESRMTLASGDAYTTGTVNTWQLLSTDRTWELAQTVVGFSINQGTLEIRRVADDVVGRTATIDMESEVE